MQSNFSRRHYLAATLSAISTVILGNPAAAKSTVTPVELEPITMIPSLLTVVAPDGSETTYTQSELEALGAYRMITSTEWHGEDATFEGVLFTDLLARHGFPGDAAVRVIAENDYGVTFLPDEIASAPVVISTRVNGGPMTRRSRGPYFFAIDADEVADDRGLNGRHLVWFARTIRLATPEEK